LLSTTTTTTMMMMMMMIMTSLGCGDAEVGKFGSAPRTRTTAVAHFSANRRRRRS
jgi:hypothetical protein